MTANLEGSFASSSGDNCWAAWGWVSSGARVLCKRLDPRPLDLGDGSVSRPPARLFASTCSASLEWSSIGGQIATPCRPATAPSGRPCVESSASASVVSSRGGPGRRSAFVPSRGGCRVRRASPGWSDQRGSVLPIWRVPGTASRPKVGRVLQRRRAGIGSAGSSAPRRLADRLPSGCGGSRGAGLPRPRDTRRNPPSAPWRLDVNQWRVASVAQPQQALAYSPQLLAPQQYQQAHLPPVRLPLPQAPTPPFPPRSVTSLPLLDSQHLLASLPSAPPPPVLPSAGPFDPRRMDVRSAEILPPWQPTPPDVSVAGWSRGPPPLRAMGYAVEMLTDSHSVLRSSVSPCKMPHDPLQRCAMAAADLAVVSTRVQPVPASGTVLDPRLLAVMRTVSASVDSAAAVDIVGGAVSALMLLGDYVRALLEEAGADEAV
ncbi:hypothetical protein CLOM_g9853 [Closterium sp. NIES-68]|nr:hypothetical protein CLOM_g9853 [Closterium sp. NIES-68]